MKGHRLAITSVTAWMNSGWPGLRFATCVRNSSQVWYFMGLDVKEKNEKPRFCTHPMCVIPMPGYRLATI